MMRPFPAVTPKPPGCASRITVCAMPTVPIQVPVKSGFPSGLCGIEPAAGRAAVPRPSSPAVVPPPPRPSWPDAGVAASRPTTTAIGIRRERVPMMSSFIWTPSMPRSPERARAAPAAYCLVERATAKLTVPSGRSWFELHPRKVVPQQVVDEAISSSNPLKEHRVRSRSSRTGHSATGPDPRRRERSAARNVECRRRRERAHRGRRTPRRETARGSASRGHSAAIA